MNTDSLAWLTEQDIAALGHQNIPDDSAYGHLGNALQALLAGFYTDCISDGGSMRPMVAFDKDDYKRIVARIRGVVVHLQDTLRHAQLQDSLIGTAEEETEWLGYDGLPLPRKWAFESDEFEEGLEPEDHR